MAEIRVRDCPDDLKLRLQSAATKNGRSLNREVIVRLKQSLTLKGQAK